MRVPLSLAAEHIPMSRCNLSPLFNAVPGPATKLHASYGEVLLAADGRVLVFNEIKVLNAKGRARSSESTGLGSPLQIVAKNEKPDPNPKRSSILGIPVIIVRYKNIHGNKSTPVWLAEPSQPRRGATANLATVAEVEKGRWRRRRTNYRGRR